jgi:hypothetical protein
VCIWTSSEEVPASPSWFGEVVLLTAHLRKHVVFNKITGQVRFARRRLALQPARRASRRQLRPDRKITRLIRSK